MTIIVRPFRPGTGDDAGAKALEAKASQHPLPPVVRDLVKFHLEHLACFDSKPNNYDRGVVLLALDTEVSGHGSASGDGFVCGCVCVGVKRAWLHGRTQALGYLFDMRVHEDYQRRRIGSQLYKAAEDEARRLGVDVMYLTVNISNGKARKFYERHGYAEASHRALVFRPLLFAGFPRLGGGRRGAAPPQRLSAREAALLADGVGGQEDLALEGGLGKLLGASSGRFVDAWVLRSEGPGEPSFATLILWDGDGTSTIKVERLLLTPAGWRHPLTQAGLLAAGCTVLALWGRSLLLSPPGPLRALSGLCLACVAAAGALLAGLLRFVTSRERERARLVAPATSGPRGLELLQELVPHARAEAKRRGFAITIANLDVRDPRLRAFGGRTGGGGQTVFMAKGLAGAAAGEESLTFGAQCFFDPRDLS